MKPKEIVIGGAQFGSKYGITNKNRFNENNVKNNIKLLKTKNINCFDTSNLYKKSNQIIGNLNYDDSNKYYAKFYIDKHRFEISKNKDNYLSFFFGKIFNDLKTKKIYCLSFHRFDQIKYNNSIIFKYLLYLKKNNKINKIGVSISNLSELIASIDLENIDLIQLPFNILEHRWKNYEDKIYKSKAQGKIFQVRSIFLQGLLLSNKNTLWSKANCENNSEIFQWIEKYYLKSNSKNHTDFFIRYINSIDWIDSFILGFNNKNEIIENLSYLNNKKISKKLIHKIEESKIKINEEILNPTYWKI